MSRWPLVGRDSELAHLRHAVRSGPGATGGAVLVGPAGVGKTRLLAELLDGERAAGRRVARISATYSSRPIPLGAVADWIPASGSHQHADPVALLSAAFVQFSREGGALPLLTVDDAHLLDPLTASLVHRLAVSRSVSLLVTVRAGELAPDAITGLWKDGLVERVDLAPLPSDAVQDLLERRLGGPVETRTGRRLTELAAGSTLFLRELVESALASGHLTARDGLWHWRSPASLGTSVLDLIRVRLRDLGEEERTVCELLGQAEPLPLSLLAGLGHARTVEALEDRQLVLVAAGEADRADTSMVRLGHPLYGEMLRSTTPETRARRLRTTVLTALEGWPPTDEVDQLRRAVLLLDSDSPARATDLVAAAGIASALFDYPLAERLGRAAMAAGGGFPARLATAYAMVRSGQPGTAAALTELVDAAGDAAELSAAVGLRVSVHFWIDSRLDEARRELAATRAVVDGPARLPLDALHACFEFFDGRPTAAAAAARPAIEAPGADPFTVAWASAAAAISCAVTGRSAEALEHVRRGEHAAGQLHNERFVHLPLGNGEMLALGLGGRLDEASRRADALQELARTAPIGDTSAITDLFAGQAALWRGDLDTAVRRLREALLRLDGYDPGEWSDQCRIWLAQALAMAGHPGEAGQALAKYVGDYAAFHPLLTVSRAWILAATGEVDRAIRTAHRAAEAARAQGQSAVEVFALHTAVRWGDSTPARRLAELAAVVDGPRVSCAADHAAALAHRDPAALGRAAVRWQDLGALALAADATAQAAATYRRTGDGARAVGAVRQARSLGADTGVRTPAMTALAGATPLTVREQEVATMAAHGLSNADIAGRLVVSVRTVEGHLQQVYAKLGINRRAGLRPALDLTGRIHEDT